MTKVITSLFAVAFLFTATDSFGFGKKNMQITELKGVTETQVSQKEGRATIMVRGKAAELIFNTMKKRQEEQTDTAALALIGNKDTAEVSVYGKQVTCSKITKKKAADYACAFDLEKGGTVAAAREVYDPTKFNLARTETGSKVFKKLNSRGLASVGAPETTLNKGQAYLVYDTPGQANKAESALIVFRGAAAKDILALLEDDKSSGMREAHWGEAKGRRGQDIACVDKLNKQPERCAMVVTFSNGSVSRDGNPLFR
jgi:hypothetical protein